MPRSVGMVVIVARKENRRLAGLTPVEVAPVYHSTDSYAKHRLSLDRFWAKQHPACLQAVSSTPRGDSHTAVPGKRGPTLSLGVCLQTYG